MSEGYRGGKFIGIPCKSYRGFECYYTDLARIMAH